jgi:dihydropteroate synthase
VSRKGFIGKIGGAAQADQRAPGSIAVGLAGLAQGVQILRVHDVADTVQAVRLWQAVR